MLSMVTTQLLLHTRPDMYLSKFTKRMQTSCRDINVPEDMAIAPTRGATGGATLLCVKGAVMASLLLPLFLPCVIGWPKLGITGCIDAAGATSRSLFIDEFIWPPKELASICIGVP